MKRHILIGAGASFLLLLVYTGIITLAQGLDHALDQAYDLWYWMVVLAFGFGIQAGLFSFARHGLNQRRGATTAAVTASGGVSAGSMVACCAHHLTDILPFLGMAGLAAFLSSYQGFFLTAGVLSNIVGITVMLEAIQRHGLSQKLTARRWNMNLVKRGSMISSGLILVATLFINFLTSSGV